MASVDWTDINKTNDPIILLDIIIRNVNSSLDLIVPLKKITHRNDKPNISLKNDILAAMETRDKARKTGNKDQFKKLKNVVNKLVKRDKIKGTLSRLGSTPCPSKAWQDANCYLGKGRGSLLPECTNNTDPSLKQYCTINGYDRNN